MPVNEQPGNLRTSAPPILIFLGLALAWFGEHSQELADAGLAIPAGVLALAVSAVAALTGYFNQKKAEIAPPSPQAVAAAADVKPAKGVQDTLALATQQAFQAGDYELVKSLAAAGEKLKPEVKP